MQMVTRGDRPGARCRQYWPPSVRPESSNVTRNPPASAVAAAAIPAGPPPMTTRSPHDRSPSCVVTSRPWLARTRQAR